MNPNHGTTNCYNDQDINSLLGHLQLQSGNYDTLSLNIRGFTLAPDFENAALHKFRLNNSSPVVDRGIFINNFSDLVNVNYNGNSPDIGALENDGSLTSVKNKVINSAGFIVYPNPSSGSFIVNSNENFRGAKLIIRNVLGQQINQALIIMDNNTFVTINGSPGIYFLEIISLDGKVDKCKVVKY